MKALDSPSHRIERFRSLVALGHWQAALGEMEGACTGQGDEELLYLKGMCHARLGAVQEASETWEKAALMGHVQSRLQLGLLLSRQARPAQRRRAKAHLHEALDCLDGGAEIEGVERLFFALGALCAEEGDDDRAARMLRRGLAVDPLSAAGHNSLGQVLQRAGQFIGAVGEYKIAIQLEPAFADPYTNLARLLLRVGSDGEWALEYAHIIDEFGQRAPQVLAMLAREMVAVGKEQVYEGFYTKGHQLKNRMGLVGSRLRRAARNGGGAAGDLQALETDYQRLYEEWVAFLGAMKREGLRAVDLDAARLVGRVVEMLQSQPWSSALRVRVQEQVPALEGDERMLREALLNLCLNALEILEPFGGGSVEVSVGYDGEGERVFIEVEDDGPGIEEAYWDLIFEPGFSMREGGNGYGLNIARRIVQAHGGALRVVSRRGKGTVFRMDLPLRGGGSDSG